MIVWSSAFAAAPFVLDVPFPTERLFDKPDRVCLILPYVSDDNHTETVMDDFSVSCKVEGGRMWACVSLETKTWPDYVPPLICGTEDHPVRMRPVRAFDPSEDIWDGVSLVRDVAVLQAAYRVDHRDVPGILAAGRCGIDSGKFWFETKNPARRQTCVLVLGEDDERQIPIRLVRKLRQPRAAFEE